MVHKDNTDNYGLVRLRKDILNILFRIKNIIWFVLKCLFLLAQTELVWRSWVISRLQTVCELRFTGLVLSDLFEGYLWFAMFQSSSQACYAAWKSNWSGPGVDSSCLVLILTWSQSLKVSVLSQSLHSLVLVTIWSLFRWSWLQHCL